MSALGGCLGGCGGENLCTVDGNVHTGADTVEAPQKIKNSSSI